MSKKAGSEVYNTLIAVFGGFLYAAGYRLILVPLHLYSGGFTGIAQVILYIMENFLHVSLPAGIDYTGIFLWLLNVPLFFLAWKIVSRNFFMKTLITVCFQSLFMSMIPAPGNPIFSDPLICCIAGGVISGFGVGITLRYGGSGGGIDIVGIYCAKRFPTFSVGKVTLLINAAIYTFGALTRNLETAIYSIIFCYIASIMTDKIHFQNIKTCAIIVTKNAELEEKIIHELHRGCTTWEGKGGYLKQPNHIIMTILSKYECHHLRQMVHNLDPHAFVTFQDHLEVDGNFEKRFDA